MNALRLATFGACLLSGSLSAQRTTENEGLEREIRRLEQVEIDAILRHDLPALDKIWAEDLTVNNPFNNVVRASEGPLRSGALTFSSYVRVAETILVRGNAVIVMGAETIVPTGNSPDAGQTIRYRYTNIWMNRSGKWLLSARHANKICQP